MSRLLEDAPGTEDSSTLCSQLERVRTERTRAARTLSLSLSLSLLLSLSLSLSLSLYLARTLEMSAKYTHICYRCIHM